MLQGINSSKSGFETDPQADACYELYIQITLGLTPTLELTLVTSYISKNPQADPYSIVLPTYLPLRYFLTYLGGKTLRLMLTQ